MHKKTLFCICTRGTDVNTAHSQYLYTHHQITTQPPLETLPPSYLDEKRHNTPRRQRKSPVSYSPQNSRNTPRMTSDGEKSASLVNGEDILECLMQTHSLCCVSLPLIWFPKVVRLAEVWLEGVGREFGVDVRGCAAAVTGMFAVGFAEKLARISNTKG